MSIRVAVNHKTHYQYDRLVSLSPHIFRLRPAVHSRTPIEAYSFNLRPKQHFINWQQDAFGNYLARVVFPEKTKELAIAVELIANMTVINPFDFFVEDNAEEFPFTYEDQLRLELTPYLEIKEKGPLLTKWLSRVGRTKRRTIDFLVDLNRQLSREVAYTIRMEPGVQTCEETLEKALGSCRDSGWLLVQILRHLGLAARFVSGYLIQLTADVKSLDGPSGPEHDFTDLHAWSEVYLPGAGWVGLDPTSGLFAAEGHIPLACAPDPVSAAPVAGAMDACEVEFTFSNSIKRIHEDPRVTKPYTEEQWATINALGRKVDEDLNAGDVRLTMGGEPTFVSIDDMDSPEWNYTADSPLKRRLAGDLVQRLGRAFGHGGALHYGQGKWYPGEALPRWRLSHFWRTDGVPIWRDPKLMSYGAKDGAEASSAVSELRSAQSTVLLLGFAEATDYGYGDAEAARFANHLARKLGVNPRHIAPGYEDTFYYVWKEGELPVNVDPLKANLEDSLERRHLAKLLERGLGTPTGYALPVRWDFAHNGWRSTPWQFRREHMFLIPGDSPMGFRLPLESLPWVAPEKREPIYERSLFEALPPLPIPKSEIPAEAIKGFLRTQSEIGRNPKSESVAHTAVCVEPRNGQLYIFLPPVTYLEHYLDMIAAIEATAEELSMPVVLEGYEPPQDYRLQRILVTPDPGVIEVNIHPAASWDELVENTTTLYEEARKSRLGTEKFMLDGRHTGTGGGNHVTLGGITPSDSPMLRRPDLLRSMITYWQHHPGLSYLFSGLFIGPTSQSPRADEGRNEQLYELEIAFEQMPEGETSMLWLVDRLLRHLLVDLTGNTHRAEFCIDKLYSPDSASGQLGLVEFRAFEMPPHAQMSLVQMLLIRALVARFWKTPYKHKLVRWGTELHDRFMLPHYVREDLRDVVNNLNSAGYPFQMAWLDPFFEFRFPHYGTVHVQGIEVELRMAIEPWHVLGEEVTRVGTARFVDSSVERLQVKLQGLTDSRYVVVCNGRRLALRSTGVHGEYVGGVRYRAWQPESALHPTIGVHSPLVFDIIDTWNGRSIGGCTYHVVHPGGRGYEIFPVNALEAEARRVSRFWNYGHTPGVLELPPDVAKLGQFFPEGHPPGPMEPPREEITAEYPYTLDLRRPPER